MGCLGFVKDAYANLGHLGNNFRDVPFLDMVL